MPSVTLDFLVICAFLPKTEQEVVFGLGSRCHFFPFFLTAFTQLFEASSVAWFFGRCNRRPRGTRSWCVALLFFAEITPLKSVWILRIGSVDVHWIWVTIISVPFVQRSERGRGIREKIILPRHCAREISRLNLRPKQLWVNDSLML